MQQLVFIHGGETFDTYKEYIDALRSWEYEPFEERSKRWKDSLAEELGDQWQVLMPSMPSKMNAKYLEWCLWFEKVEKHLTDGVVLVGYSLGGIFLAKYLSEGPFPVTVRATFLLAAPFDTDSGPLADFGLPSSLAALKGQGGKIFLYHSEDDDVVPFSELDKYRAQLPDATVRTFADHGHFQVPELPELVADLKAL